MAFARYHVNLLYISADETSHYVLVQDLSRLVSRQYNNHNNKTCFCQYSLYVCTSEEVLKTIWKDASYTGHEESSSKGLMTRRGVTKSSLQKQNTNYVYLLPSMWISKVFYVNKTRVSHHHRSRPPSNTSITYHVVAASM